MARGGWSERGTALKTLSHNHFSFFKGIINGLDSTQMYQRYIQVDSVATKKGQSKAANQLRHWILQELTFLAGRHDRQSGIRILKIAPEALKVSELTLERLEEFESRMGLTGFYTEKELLAEFEKHHANSKELLKNAQKARIRQKQLDLLNHLVSQATPTPKPGDLLSGWLDPILVKHFEAAGVFHVGDLVAGINGFGFNWHRKIPGIGKQAAIHIVSWLTDEPVAQALGIVVRAQALLPANQLRSTPLSLPLETAIVPIERLKVPHELDGSAGTNRLPAPNFGAHNDKQAIELWLASFSQKKHTHRAYRKEAERFLLWAVFEKQKPLSSITFADCIDYRDFLSMIGLVKPIAWAKRFAIEQSAWQASRSYPRYSPLWRPFESKLNLRSQNYAIGVLTALFEFLVSKHYVSENPFVGISTIAPTDPIIDVSRTLDTADIAAIKDYLLTKTEQAPYRRLYLILLLLYSTGLRMAEISGLKRGNFGRFIRLEDSAERWQITVVGKGNKPRKIEVSPTVMDILRDDFIEKGLPSFIEAPEDTPLISTLSKHTEALGKDRIYDILKAFFAEVANSLPFDDLDRAKRLRKASTHWLRHTFATNALASGMSLEVVRELLGHASLATTSIYVQTERDRRSVQMDSFIEKAGF